jgi:hypothetical protein
MPTYKSASFPLVTAVAFQIVQGFTIALAVSKTGYMNRSVSCPTTLLQSVARSLVEDAILLIFPTKNALHHKSLSELFLLVAM